MRIVLLLLLLLFLSCSDDQAGSVSEAGNAKVSCTILNSADSVAKGIPVVLVPTLFHPVLGDRDTLSMDTTNELGVVSFTVDSGTYNLWATANDEVLFHKDVTLQEYDSLHLDSVRMSEGGTVVISDAALSRLYTLGTPTAFVTTTVGEITICNTIPTGTHDLILEKDTAVVEKSVAVTTQDTAYIKSNLRCQVWLPQTNVANTYHLVESDGKLLTGTFHGLSIYENDSWQHFTLGNSGLLTDWILHVAPFEGVYYLATDSGLAHFDGTTITPVESITKTKITQLVTANDTLWCTDGSQIFSIAQSNVATEYLNSDVGTANAIRTLLPESDTFWVGTNSDGLYYKSGDTWQRDTTFASNWASIEIYLINRFDGKLWLSTTTHGIFYGVPGNWQQFSTGEVDAPEDKIYSSYVDTLANRILFGNYQGQLISYNSGEFQIIDDLRGYIGNTGIFAINRVQEKLYLGTYGRGLVIVDEQ